MWLLPNVCMQLVHNDTYAHLHAAVGRTGQLRMHTAHVGLPLSICTGGLRRCTSPDQPWNETAEELRRRRQVQTLSVVLVTAVIIAKLLRNSRIPIWCLSVMCQTAVMGVSYAALVLRSPPRASCSALHVPERGGVSAFVCTFICSPVVQAGCSVWLPSVI